MNLKSTNTLKHEPAIIALFAALQEVSQEERKSLYDSLAVLVSDLETDLTEKASNAHYLVEKTGLFLGACKVVALIDPPPNSYEGSVDYAKGNFVKVQS